eukprot:364546-Chlamydomonas_euryale.AAC.12
MEVHLPHQIRTCKPANLSTCTCKPEFGHMQTRAWCAPHIPDSDSVPCTKRQQDATACGRINIQARGHDESCAEALLTMPCMLEGYTVIVFHRSKTHDGDSCLHNSYTEGGSPRLRWGAALKL